MRNFRVGHLQHLTRQAMYCTYNVTLRRVRAAIFVVEKQKVLRIPWGSVCGVRDPAWNSHAPYYLRSLWLYNIFPHYLTNGTIFGKISLKIKCVVLFSLQLLSERFCIIKKNWARYNQNCVSVFKTSNVIVVQFSRNMNFLDMFSKNTPISHFMKILPVWCEFCHADRRTDMTKLIVALRNFANAPSSEGLHSSSDQPAGQRPERFRLAFVLRAPI